MIKPYYDHNGITIYHGDCLEIMKDIPDYSIDTIITDPPYALEFMGKGWDKVLPGIEIWRECLRVAKPGAMLMAFGGTRTYHRLTCAIEDACWEIRDCVMWVYGSGFPKSHDISKAIDKRAGAEREVVGLKIITGCTPDREIFGANDRSNGKGMGFRPGEIPITTPSTPEAQTWEGYGTALKPGYEPIVLAMKPLEGTFAQNALKWGVGGLWIDGGRIPSNGNVAGTSPSHSTPQKGWDRPWRHDTDAAKRTYEAKKEGNRKAVQLGRWPANLIHDGSEEVVELFPVTKSGSLLKHHNRSGGMPPIGTFEIRDRTGEREFLGDQGSAARFFYCAKASRSERNAGLTDPGPQFKHGTTLSMVENTNTKGNNHPTVKPLALMQYLCKLTMMPDGGTILDSFIGSGTTLVAAKKLGRKAIGIEIEEQYCEIAADRLRQGVFDFKTVNGKR